MDFGWWGYFYVLWFLENMGYKDYELEHTKGFEKALNWIQIVSNLDFENVVFPVDKDDISFVSLGSYLMYNKRCKIHYIFSISYWNIIEKVDLIYLVFDNPIYDDITDSNRALHTYNIGKSN